MVGAEGFELSTSSSQSWRSTRLSYTPKQALLAAENAVKGRACYVVRGTSSTHVRQNS